MTIEAKPEKVEKRLYNVAEAAGYLRSIGAGAATVSFVRTLIGTGAVAYIRVGRAFYVTRAALDQWIERHERRSRG